MLRSPTGRIILENTPRQLLDRHVGNGLTTPLHLAAASGKYSLVEARHRASSSSDDDIIINIITIINYHHPSARGVPDPLNDLLGLSKSFGTSLP